jgi:nucleoid DNA-binding protein
VPNVSKHDLIVDVSKSTGLTQADTNVIVKELLEIISEFLERDEIIELRGFGTFYRKMRKPRLARNPRTGEGVPLLKRLVPLFKYSKELKASISAT